MSFLHYIMGRMPEPERSRFEGQLLEDQDFSDAGAVCEQELIDAYVLHRLGAEDTQAIRLWIEASPSRVERAAMARALLKAIPQRGLQRKQVGAALAIAACLLMGATLYLVNLRVSRHKQEIAQLSAVDTLSPQSQPKTATLDSGGVAKPDVILIAAERTRGEQKTTVYQVHRKNPVQLQIILPSETARSSYRIQIAPLSDQSKVLFQQNGLEARSLSGQLYLTVALPSGSLPPATYTVSVIRPGDTLTSTFTVKWVNE